MSTIDMICAGIFIGYALLGYWKGAIRTLIDMVGLIASFVLAIAVAPAIARWVLENPQWSEQLHSILAVIVAKVLLAGKGNRLLLPVLSPEVLNALQSGQRIGESELALSLKDYMTPLVGIAVQVVVFAAVFILFGIVMTFLRRLARKTNDLPVLGAVNRALGMVLGGIKGMVLVIVGLAFLYFGAFIGQNLSLLTTLEQGLLTGPVITWLSQWIA